jgi:hypothetical protein
MLVLETSGAPQSTNSGVNPDKKAENQTLAIETLPLLA